MSIRAVRVAPASTQPHWQGANMTVHVSRCLHWRWYLTGWGEALRFQSHGRWCQGFCASCRWYPNVLFTPKIFPVLVTCAPLRQIYVQCRCVGSLHNNNINNNLKVFNFFFFFSGFPHHKWFTDTSGYHVCQWAADSSTKVHVLHMKKDPAASLIAEDAC